MLQYMRDGNPIAILSTICRYSYIVARFSGYLQCCNAFTVLVLQYSRFGILMN